MTLPEYNVSLIKSREQVIFWEIKVVVDSVAARIRLPVQQTILAISQDILPCHPTPGK